MADYNRPYRELSKAEKKRYDKAIGKLYAHFTSWNKIAFAVIQATDNHVTGQGFRQWSLDYKMPLNHACVLQEITDGLVTVYDFVPWLADYTQLRESAEAA